MSENRPWQIDRETAERLLRGESAVPSDGYTALACVLAAAAAPAQPGELAGESAAMTAYWEASRSDTPRPEGRPQFRTRVARFLTVKAAAVAVAVMAFGGATLAAGTGVLPVTLTQSGQHQPPTARTSKSAVPVAPTVSPHTVGPIRPATTATPKPSLPEQCRSYFARLKKAGGKPPHGSNKPGHDNRLSADGEKKMNKRCQAALRALQQGSGEQAGGEHGGGQQGDRSIRPGTPAKTPTSPTGHPSSPTQQAGGHDDN